MTTDRRAYLEKKARTRGLSYKLLSELTRLRRADDSQQPTNEKETTMSAKKTTKKTRRARAKAAHTFHGANLTETIHWLGRHGFDRAGATEILTKAGFKLSEHMVGSHLGCARNAPKKGLSDWTNKHRLVIAKFTAPVSKRLLESLKTEKTVAVPAPAAKATKKQGAAA